MRRLGFILLYIAVGMICFGLGWLITESLKENYMKKNYNHTANLECCMKYCKESWKQI